MTVDTNIMVSITEENHKNNVPRYLVNDYSKADDSAVAGDEDVLEISKRLLAQNKEAYEVLAK